MDLGKEVVLCLYVHLLEQWCLLTKGIFLSEILWQAAVNIVKRILSSIVDNAGTAAVGCVFFLLFALVMQFQLCSSKTWHKAMTRDVLYFILCISLSVALTREVAPSSNRLLFTPPSSFPSTSCIPRLFIMAVASFAHINSQMTIRVLSISMSDFLEDKSPSLPQYTKANI